jgi:hypothetical protein
MRTPQQGAQPGEQLLEGEWLWQVVVGAHIETRDPIGHCVASCEHENGQVLAGRPEAPARLQPVEPGHHQVEDNSVRPARLDCVEGLEAVSGQVDVVPVEGE